MGASQSTGGESGSGAAAGGSGGVKTSYYELLGVERTATQDELKKAYRKKALELHPDRNYGDVERTTALFAEVQTAYQVLSDDQERAWYDAHEGDILRGGEGGGEDHYEHGARVTTADDLSRMMGKFRANVDYSDSPNGFFGFVREAFEQLRREEEHAADYEGVNIPDYPSFGHKDDGHEDVVRNFYAMWGGFSTAKSFAWMDVYRLSEAPDRRVRRLMEKENIKNRETGKRDFNDAVRTLVAFVRKRDPRIKRSTQTAEQEAKAQRDARKAQAARSRAAHLAKMQEAVPEWATKRDPDEVEEESDESVEEEHYECVACNKTFKSERQYEAHEKSKKHQKAVQALRRKMQKDNARLNLDEDAPSSGAMTPIERNGEASEDSAASNSGGLDSSVYNVIDEVENLTVHDDSTDDDTDGSRLNDSAHKDTQHKPQAPAATKSNNDDGDDDENDDDDNDDEYASRSTIEARLASSNVSTLGIRTPGTESIDEESIKTQIAESAAPKLGKAAQKRAKKAAKQAELDQSDFKHKCQACNAGFPSRTQLFQHISDFGHAALKTGGGGAGGGKKKGKRK